VNVAKSDGDDLPRGVFIGREAVRHACSEQCLKAVDIEGAICVEHDGDFVPASETERKDTGTDQVVEKVGLPGACRSLNFDNIAAMKGRQI
jgi:hypothetical protein